MLGRAFGSVFQLSRRDAPELVREDAIGSVFQLFRREFPVLGREVPEAVRED
jgi:hypothetical protein